MKIFTNSFSRGSLAFTSLMTASAMAAPAPTAEGMIGELSAPYRDGPSAFDPSGAFGEIVGSPGAQTQQIVAARPFSASYGDAASPGRALECLTQAVYYEGASEPDSGQQAIAQVVLNRVSHPAFPATVCGVVYEGAHRATGCQFTFTCDGSLARRPSSALWARARRTAQAALGGMVAEQVGRATHYHADYVDPYWSGSLDRIDQVGAHIFYVWRGKAGREEAFAVNYAGVEPDPVEFVPAPPSTPSAAPAPEQEERFAPEPQLAGTIPEPVESEPEPFRPRPLRLAE